MDVLYCMDVLAQFSDFLPVLPVANSNCQQQLLVELQTPTVQPMSTHSHQKELTYLRCRLDTAVNENKMPASVHEKLFHGYSLTQLGPVQANLKDYSLNGMNDTCELNRMNH